MRQGQGTVPQRGATRGSFGVSTALNRRVETARALTFPQDKLQKAIREINCSCTLYLDQATMPEAACVARLKLTREDRAMSLHGERLRQAIDSQAKGDHCGGARIRSEPEGRRE